MPLYEYQCRSCGKTTDVRHGFDETNSQVCPACGGELAKKFGAAGIVFKGSGFYVTDSRSAKSAAPGSSTRDASSTSSSSSDSSSDTKAKPETKTETKSDSTPSGGTSGSGGSATKGEGAAA